MVNLWLYVKVCAMLFGALMLVYLAAFAAGWGWHGGAFQALHTEDRKQKKSNAE